MESEEVMEGKEKVEDKEGEKAMRRGLELWPKAVTCTREGRSI